MTWRRGGCAGITGMLASLFRETLAGWPFTLSPVSGRLAACPCLLVACGLSAGRPRAGAPAPRPPFMASFFHLRNASSHCLQHPVGAPHPRKRQREILLPVIPSAVSPFLLLRGKAEHFGGLKSF